MMVTITMEEVVGEFLLMEQGLVGKVGGELNGELDMGMELGELLVIMDIVG